MKFEDKDRAEAAWWLVAVWSVKAALCQLSLPCSDQHAALFTETNIRTVLHHCPAFTPTMYLDQENLQLFYYLQLCSVRFRFQNHSEVPSCQQVQNIILQ